MGNQWLPECGNLRSDSMPWGEKSALRLSCSHLLHDADGLGAVLRRRVQQDPVVQRLQHRLHRLHAAHQAHELRGDVAHGSHHRRNPGGGAGGATGPPAVIGHPCARGVDLLANSCRAKTQNRLQA